MWGSDWAEISQEWGSDWEEYRRQFPVRLKEQQEMEIGDIIGHIEGSLDYIEHQLGRLEKLVEAQVDDSISNL